MKAVEKYFRLEMFLMLFKVVLTCFKVWIHSQEVIRCSTVHYAVERARVKSFKLQVAQYCPFNSRGSLNFQCTVLWIQLSLRKHLSLNLHWAPNQGGGGGGFTLFPSFFALLENEWLSVKALNMWFLVEVPHGFFRFTTEKWQVNSFYYVAKFSIMRLMCFFERIRSYKNNFRSLICWLSSATVSQWAVISILNRSCGTQSNCSKAKDFKNQHFKPQSLLWKELTFIDLSFSPQNLLLNVGYFWCHISQMWTTYRAPWRRLFS